MFYTPALLSPVLEASVCQGKTLRRQGLVGIAPYDLPPLLAAYCTVVNIMSLTAGA